jgi:putative endonuclease
MRRSRTKVTPPWFLYVVRCADGTLYTGIASDVARRIAEHLKANGKGSKYLRGRGPLELVFVQGCESRGAALSLESRMKRLSRAEKEGVIQSHGSAFARGATSPADIPPSTPSRCDSARSG